MPELRNIDLASNIRILIRTSGIRTTCTLKCTIRSSSTDSPLTLAQRSPDCHQHTFPRLTRDSTFVRRQDPSVRREFDHRVCGTGSLLTIAVPDDLQCSTFIADTQ